MDQKEKMLESTESYLCSLISEVANLTITDNDASTPFQELGIDSFKVLQIIKSLEEEFGTLPKTLLFENFNISDLSNYFVEKHEQTLLEKFSGNQEIIKETAQKIEKSKNNTSANEVGSEEEKNKVNQVIRNPVIIREKEAINHPDLKDWYYQIFHKYKNEGSASRGTRNISPYLFIGSEQKGYFNYSRSKNILLVYAYTGPEDYLPVISEEIYKYCEENSLELTLFSAYPIEKVGNTEFTSTPFGVISRILNIKEFNLKGKSMRRLRYLVSKFKGAGNCKTIEYKCGTDKETDKQIAKLIDLWSEPRTMVNPLIHIVKEEILTGNLSPEHRLFLTYLDDTLQNAILISKLSDHENGYLMDLEFYPKSMPLGGLEYAIVQMIETLAQEGHDMLSLGGTYGCKLDDFPANPDPYLEKTLDFLREQNIFNDEGNLQFKNKFRPENTPVYLCRAKENSNPDNVTDVIMMIADPSKLESEITEEKTYEKLSLEMPAITHKIDGFKTDSSNVKEPKSSYELSEDKSVIIEGEERSQTLAEFKYNPLNIPNNKVDFDLKTDSWAQLDAPVIDAQMSFLHSQLYQPVHIEESLKNVFPFSFFALTSSGRNAEKALFKSWPKKGIVIQNLLFPTAIYNQIENGFSPVEIPHKEVFNLGSDVLYKGNLHWESLVDQVKKDHDEIAFVAIEIANNTAGGAPVSMEHLKKVKDFLSEYSIPLIIDGTRVLENAKFIIENEKEYAEKSIWEVARTIFSFADIVWASLAKDFCVNKGGIIATNDQSLFYKLQDTIQDEGIGLDVIDKKLIAHSFKNQKKVENLVLERMECVRLIHDALKKFGITVMQPVGGHCILIDVMQFSMFKSFEHPIPSFVAWMYLNTGIRSGAHSTGMQKNTTLNNLVRLAIPVGLNRNQANKIINKLLGLFKSMQNIPEVIPAGSSPETSWKTFADYKLKKFHNVSTKIVSISEAVNPANDHRNPLADTTDIKSNSVLNHPEKDQVKTSKGKYQPCDIAIVGMSGRYPKAKNLDQLWNNLIEGKDCVETIPEERLKQRKKTKFTKKYRGGFLMDVDKFDSMFFNIPPAVAEMFDPQERLLLETAWESIEDAGYYPEILTPEGTPKNIGVFVGAVWTMYQVLGAEEKLLGNDTNPNSFLWSVANRISYCLNLSGPSLSVDTACSSSMTALYLACEAIYNGECSGAVVGGVNLDLHQSKFDINSFGGALSPDGVCRTFGKGANGYVAGEGIGAIFLKPLAQAEKDGDNIHGVIKSVSINHGGRTSGYMVPDPKAQASLILTALEKADIDAKSIGYIEAHGTGTELGDPIEISGLTTAFQKYSVENQSVAIGSVKTNIGHLEAAAGVVGIHKVLLQMKHKKLVPSLHSTELNEFIDFENSPFYVEQELEDWKPKEIDGVKYPLRAGISSFGAGGANAHVIIESYEKEIQKNHNESPAKQIFPLSALKEDRLVEYAKKLRTFLEHDLTLDASDQKSIKDIGHTLRVGRKSFEHRLVIIATTKQELIEKLTLFIDNKKDDNILSGEIQTTGNITRLLSKKEKQGFIKLISESGDLRKIGQLWIEGIINDWQGFALEIDARRISLPTYPFADKRHWVERKEDSGVLSVSSVAHPLIDINESTFERQLFRKTFHDKEFFIYDHLVSDIPTLPGVAYLDFARKAGELAAGRKVKSIKNIIWVNPIAVTDSQPLDVWIELIPQGEQVKFEVFSKNSEGIKQLHSQGKLTYVSNQEEEVEPEFIDIKGIKARCEKVADGKDAYPLFHNLGLGLGPSFQVLQEVYKNEDEMLGIMQIPDVCEDDFQDFLLHPSLVDGTGQTVMAAHLTDSEASGEIFVPYSFGEVLIYNPLTPKCYSYIQKVNEPNSKLSKANLIILDENGKVLVKINESVGIPLTELHEKPAGNIEVPNAVTDKAEDEFSNLYYSYSWDHSEPEIFKADSETVENILLFDTDEVLFDIFNASDNLKKNVVLVKPGKAFEVCGEHSYKVNPLEKNDFVQLLESLKNKGYSFDNICYSWSKAPFEHMESFIQDSLVHGVYSLLYLCQAIVGLRADVNYQILYLYYGAEGTHQPHNEAVSGFAKSLHLEHSNIVCKTIEFKDGKNDISNVAGAILNEYKPETIEDLSVRYEPEGRFVRKLKNINPWGEDLHSAEKLALKEKGVYLITGGAGGLGFIFAEYLAKECKARLILSGRSELSEEKSAKIKEIEALGAEVLYEPTDVSKFEDVQKLISKGKERFGSVDGIIHSAGVLRDSSLRNKTIDEMSAVCAPKVFGTFYLDEATKDENLDFFVTFSSMAAVGGNMGQSDYSFANHFMDSFAMRRTYLQKIGERSGKSLSLDWSIWADGGMQLDAQMEMFFKNSLGIRPLRLETGIGAFTKGLLADQTQVVVVEGIQEKMEIAWGLRKKEVIPVEESASVSTETSTETTSGGSNDEVAALVQENLVKLVMDFLKLDEEDVSLDKILLDLGFDSIGLASYADAINEIYKTDVTPVLFFEYPSITEITKHLSTDHYDKVVKAHNLSAGSSAVQETNAKTAPAVESKPAAAPAFEGINKGWNANAFDQPQLNGHTGKSGISAESRFVDCPIAIIGIGGVMPKSRNMEEYWENLKNEENMISVVPRDRWIWEDYDGDPITEKNKTNSKYGGFVDDADKFDPLFFGISPREAEMMDPQQRVFLETVWSTIEDSGYKVSDLSGTKTGLFVGVAVHDYTDLMNGLNVELDGYTASGNSHCILANRISFLLNLRGPSAPIDTACSSSLIAVHRAIESIHTGSSDMAIVGGVQLMLTPAAHISFGMAGMLSSDGKCKTFDKDANGYVRGEGSGAILLKPLAQAEADNDQIYAVIKSTAENHGGKATMLTAPNPHAQAELLVEAYEKAQIDPTTVGYIECHGTGTSLGDPIEIRALVKSFKDLYDKHNKPVPQKPHIGLSSVKTNIGHLETAAGISSLLKAILAIKHKHIPASLHFNELNPHINLQGTPFYIVDKTTPWEAMKSENGKEIPRRAGVSSFGFGGANAHIVIEEYVSSKKEQAVETEGPYMFVLSARNADRLKEYTQSMLGHIEKHEVALSNLTYTLQVGRDPMTERVAFLVNSKEELKEKLSNYISGNTVDTEIYQGNVKRKNKNTSADDKSKLNGSAASTTDDLISAKKYAKLLMEWVKGADVDWNKAYGETKPKRLNLPTYPFAKESYWFDFDPNASVAVEHSALHPVLHRNTSMLKQQSYSSAFKGNEFFLSEESESHNKLLSSGGFLEMVYQGVIHAAFGKPLFKPVEFQSINWVSPFKVADNNPVSIALFEENDNQIKFDIYSKEQKDEILHCEGSVVLSDNLKPTEINIEMLKKQTGSGQFDIKEYFNIYKEMGLNGYSYPEIISASKKQKQLLLHMVVPDELKNITKDYVINPAVIDTAIHGAGALINSEGITPVNLEYMKVISPCTSEMYAWVRYSRGNAVDDNAVRIDIDLLDKDGKVCMTIKSLTFTTTNKDSSIIHSEDFKEYLDSIYDLYPNSSEDINSEFEKLLDGDFSWLKG